MTQVQGATTAPTKTADATRSLTGGQALIASLAQLGVKTVFGLPGGAILPVYDEMSEDMGFEHILVRHEQGAGHAASGYALATGRVGVVIATSGPGATNLVTPLADAARDSVPVVAITGQVAVSALGSEAFQEVDTVAITSPFTKASFLARSAAELPSLLARAFDLAASGRPGPVVVDVTKTAMTETAEFPSRLVPEVSDDVRAGQSVDAGALDSAARLLHEARRPVFYVGGGVIRAGAADRLRRLAELTGAPVVTTLMGLGALPDSHPQHLGMPGMHGSVAAVGALQRADLVVALGARFDDRVTGPLSAFAPGAKVVHVDADPAEVGKNRAADVPLVGDLRDVLDALLPRVEQANRSGRPDLSAWWSVLDRWRQEYPTAYPEDADGLEADGALSPQYVVERLDALSGPDSVFVGGVGQHQMWAAQLLHFERPNSWLTSGGLGTMGYAVPAAMGAQAGRPDAEVWAVDGDGCFQMTNQELATCRMRGLPIKVAILNNSVLGMVRQWQSMFYGSHYSNTNLRRPDGLQVPDFVRLAEAYDCLGLRVTRPDEVDDAIQRARAEHDRPTVLDFRVSKDAMVWPMAPAGLPNDRILYRPGVEPLAGSDT